MDDVRRINLNLLNSYGKSRINAKPPPSPMLVQSLSMALDQQVGITRVYFLFRPGFFQKVDNVRMLLFFS